VIWKKVFNIQHLKQNEGYYNGLDCSLGTSARCIQNCWDICSKAAIWKTKGWILEKTVNTGGGRKCLSIVFTGGFSTGDFECLVTTTRQLN
jgi:hypothetical protein